MNKEWFYFWNSQMGTVWYSDYDDAVAARHVYAMQGHKVGQVLRKS